MYNKYELLCVYSLKEASKLDQFKEETRKVIKESGFDIDSESEMGKKILAYPIRKEKEGYYYLFYLVPKTESSYKDLYKEFKRADFILRYLILGFDEERIKRLKKAEEEFKNMKIEARKRKVQKEMESKKSEENSNTEIKEDLQKE